eukprot:TRINITY_DN5103_c0_g1_i3.p1 TRINITY_DN5103_c0_g1~~TRINITY_DN5103_c0_g1_i3.p1  ORF type:complete len:159 (-),score=1.52 TRINITY_DN5103_c0_g1_i3:439-870(-)
MNVVLICCNTLFVCLFTHVLNIPGANRLSQSSCVDFLLWSERNVNKCNAKLRQLFIIKTVSQTTRRVLDCAIMNVVLICCNTLFVCLFTHVLNIPGANRLSQSSCVDFLLWSERNVNKCNAKLRQLFIIKTVSQTTRYIAQNI